MTSYLALLILVSLPLLMYVSYKETRDWINPVILAIVGIYFNFTLNTFPLTDLQTSEYSFMYCFFYWTGFLSLILVPLILFKLAKIKRIERTDILLNKKRLFGLCQSVIILFYLGSYLIRNKLLSGYYIPILFNKDVHTGYVPVISTYIIPSLGAFVIFEGFVLRQKISNYIRVALFITIPLTSGSRLLPSFLTAMFLLGYFLNHRIDLKKLVKISLFIFVIGLLFFTAGILRSSFYDLTIDRTYASHWGVQITKVQLVDDVIAVYWRYFISTFENFKRLVDTVEPLGKPLQMVSYPLTTFLQFDDFLGMLLMTDYLKTHFNNSIEGVKTVISFFGPFYLYGGGFVGGLFMLVYGFVTANVYMLSRRSIRWHAAYVVFAVSLVLGSFTSLFFSPRFIVFGISIYGGLYFYTHQNILKAVRKKKHV